MIRKVLFGSRLRGLLSLGLVLGIASVPTLATWSDSASVTTGNFTLGSVNLQLNGQNSLTGHR